MAPEEIRIDMRVRNSFQPKLCGFVRSLGGGEFQRRLRFESLECHECRGIPGNMWADVNPPIPQKTCIRHTGAQDGVWVMVEWDIRKGVLIAINPAILQPEIDLRLH
jgi:hypothetical protein